MLVNIPIAVWLGVISYNRINSVRVTVINDTEDAISNIYLLGWQNDHIPKLEGGSEETISVEIPHGCTIDIQYKVDNHQFEQMVMPYISYWGVTEYRITGVTD
ncbi:MAG: hypothetical protein JXQ90_15770 [Cyclobacteriaceae bacterium]